MRVTPTAVVDLTVGSRRSSGKIRREPLLASLQVPQVRIPILLLWLHDMQGGPEWCW